MDESVKEKSLNDLSDETRNKYDLLKQKFKNVFKEDPLFYARAPGRVNLIGEHIDYCGYSVLPMAIENDVVVAVSLNKDSEIVLTNMEECFNDYKVNLNEITINKTNPKWHDYFLSGVKGIFDIFSSESATGMNICVYGQVPKSAGLSSSSALVVCASLATIYANKFEITKQELAEKCAISEQYVGTIGGGMDQAISCLAENGSAKLIDFNPLKVHQVILPEGAQFVITNSCVEMNKAATNHFNTRVVECRLASQVLAKLLDLEWRKIKKPKELQKALGLDLAEMIDLSKKNLHTEVYTLDELCKLLETTKEEIILNSLSQNTSDLKEFQLYKRILHVFSESKRVYDFKEICSQTPTDAFEKLGSLMNESHLSCKDNYECSCEELDELTEICRNSGAYGSRLTGAGWGGCSVSLIPKEKLNSFLDQIKNLYYSKKNKLDAFETYAFSTKPSDGIFIVLP